MIERKPTIYIGYWNDLNDTNPEFPFPQKGKSPENSAIRMMEFIITNSRIKALKGNHFCRICGEDCGCEELNIDLKKTKYIIPLGYLHYLKVHFISPDENLVNVYDALMKKSHL